MITVSKEREECPEKRIARTIPLTNWQNQNQTEEGAIVSVNRNVSRGR
jgi:hypothetical protein